MSILMIVLLLAAPQEPSLTQMVDGVVRTYSRMNDFSAEFVQTTQDISNQRHTYRGLLYLKSGRRMLYNQREPEVKMLYSDGKSATDYKVGQRQAEITPLGKVEDERFQLFQIPWRADFKDQFTFAKGNERPVTPGNQLFRAIPKKKDVPEILLEVDPKTFLIQRFVTTTPDGETNEFRFTGIKTAPIDKAIFEFKPPPNVEVIRNR
jgi:outer membrane lipoprotein-sorting protein